MSDPPCEPLAVLNEVLEEHLEELAALLLRRRDATTDASENSRSLAEVDRRIEANTEGLRLGHEAGSELLIEAAEGDDSVLAAAALFAWLRSDVVPASRHAERMLDTFADGSAELSETLAADLGYVLQVSPIDALHDRLRRALESPKAPLAGLAAEVLTAHRERDAVTPHLSRLVTDDDPAVRRSAWRALAQIGRDA